MNNGAINPVQNCAELRITAMTTEGEFREWLLAELERQKAGLLAKTGPTAIKASPTASDDAVCNQDSEPASHGTEERMSCE